MRVEDGGGDGVGGGEGEAVGQGRQLGGGEDAVERSGADGRGDDEQGGGGGRGRAVGEVDSGSAVGVQEVVGGGTETVTVGEDGGPVGNSR